MPTKRSPLTPPEFHQLMTKEFAIDLNPGLDPQGLTRSSRRSCWWQHVTASGEEHTWRTSPKERAKGSRCPHCQNRPSLAAGVRFENSVAAHPVLSKEWDPDLNHQEDGLPLSEAGVGQRSTHQRGWRCLKGHTWRQSPYLRTTRGYGCPFCKGNKPSPTRNLEAYILARPTLHHLLVEWDATRNPERPSEILPFSGLKRFWKCRNQDCQEVWEASPAVRTSQGQGCPFCAGKRASALNNFEVSDPELAAQWHASLNQEFSPRQATPFSHRLAWWQCPKEPHHVWEQTIACRRKDRGCPFCTGQRTHPQESLAMLAPDIAQQFHPSLNEHLKPEHLRMGSNQRVWWTCGVEGHDPWRTTPYERTQGDSNCPQCSGRTASPQNNLRTYIEARPYLNFLLQDWDFEGNAARGLRMEDLTPASHTRVSWHHAACGHRWESAPHVRSRGIGCPACTPYAVSKTEIALRCELQAVFGIENATKPPYLWHEKEGGQVGKPRVGDILLKPLNLVLEYDGWYYHQHRVEEDRATTGLFESKGYRVIRIREAPLAALGPMDLVVTDAETLKSGWRIEKFQVYLKSLVDEVLETLLQHFGVEMDPDLIGAMRSYQNQPTVQAWAKTEQAIAEESALAVRRKRI